MRITIGGRTFIASLDDNPTAVGFRKLLPLTLDMSDVSANEKYAEISTRLPTDPSSPGMIRAGDLMLWGENGLVLFYQSFRTSYRYARLGRIEDPSGLADAVGSGGVTVTFESE